MMLRALLIWHRRMAAPRPKVARIALARALEPSMMKRRGNGGIGATFEEIADQGLRDRSVFRCFRRARADALNAVNLDDHRPKPGKI